MSMKLLTTILSTALVSYSYGALTTTEVSGSSATSLFGSTYTAPANDLSNLPDTTFTSNGPATSGFSSTGANTGGMQALGDGNSNMIFATDAQLDVAAVTMTFDFDLTTNTLGYDLTEIIMSAGFGSNSLSHAHQNYAISYSLVGSATYIPLTSGEYIPYAGTGVGTSTTTGSGFSRINITDNSTSEVIISGVDSLQFIYNKSSSNGGGSTGLVLQEIDIVGVATVPEPSSVILVMLGGLATLRRRRG